MIPTGLPNLNNAGGSLDLGSSATNGDYGASGPTIGGLVVGSTSSTSDKLIYAAVIIVGLIVWATLKK